MQPFFLPATGIYVSILPVLALVAPLSIFTVFSWVSMRFGSYVPEFTICCLEKCTATRITAVSSGLKFKPIISIWIIKVILNQVVANLVDHIVASVEDSHLGIIFLALWSTPAPSSKHEFLSNDVRFRTIPGVDVIDSFYSIRLVLF